MNHDGPVDRVATRRAIWRRLAIACAALGGIGGAFAWGMQVGGARARANDAWTDGRLLSLAIDSVRANALDSLPNDELIRRAVSGMLRELHDPYAALLRPEGFRSYRGMLLGESQGLGISLRMQGELLSVRRLADGSPAALAGVRRGDRILAWNGVSMSSWRTRTAADSVRLKGDSARLVLWRPPFGDSVNVTVRRRTWHMPAVTESGMLSDSVGYVRLASITQQSARELEQTVAALTRRGARALVLDLRGNGGGLFEEGVRAAGLFLEPGAVVASLAGRSGGEVQLHRASGGRWLTMPLTVLVDAGTASAAEVIAAALREHQRALLVGAPTYGKGVVQRVVKLSDELSLRLTTARWLTPTGRMLQLRKPNSAADQGGLQPDVRVSDPSLKDPSRLPNDWSARQIARTVAAADTAVMVAMREGWSTTPVAMLESRLREQLTVQSPPPRRPDPARAAWLATTTRLALVRMLEVDGQREALLRFSMRDDHALRTGLDVLMPHVARRGVSLMTTGIAQELPR